MDYKVLIPAAGTGSRLGGITKYLNKSLINIGNEPAISRIIEKFPKGTPFVIAVGYKGELIREFFELAYPGIDVTFVDVDPYEGKGSGLGLSILKCEKYLQCPFIFCSCDTLVNEDILPPDHNWMAYDNRDHVEQYRTVTINNGKVISINEKGVDDGGFIEPYIGLSGICDYEEFWKAMREGGEQAILQGESFGLRRLINKGIEAVKYTWFDTGIKVELDTTRKRYADTDGPNILEKENEEIWFVNGRVIKFSADEKFIRDRCIRSSELSGYVPQVTGHTTHMYSYNYVHGQVMSRCATLPLFKKLLGYSKDFWHIAEIDPKDSQVFKDTCMRFYKDKTLERIQLFYTKYGKHDSETCINGISYPALRSIISNLDWGWIADGLPGQFHGDYHFENIIYDEQADSFKMLDWRQNFGGSLETGDIYYDLAKLLHGLIICHELIAKGLYHVTWAGDVIAYDFDRKQILVECENYYYQWLQEKGYDVKKVKALTALIFLNIAGLHEYPYSLLLYGLGKSMLYRCLHEDRGAYEK